MTPRARPGVPLSAPEQAAATGVKRPSVSRRIRASVKPVVNPVDGIELPHERDEAVNNTKPIESAPMQQAYRDLARGLKDTDRGAEAGRMYKKLKKG